MSATNPPAASAPDDPRPVPPPEPQLEDCCGTGCVHCVFDMYQVALDNYERALLAWEARHPAPPGRNEVRSDMV